jgi:hypothetical protein
VCSELLPECRRSGQELGVAVCAIKIHSTNPSTRLFNACKMYSAWKDG